MDLTSFQFQGTPADLSSTVHAMLEALLAFQSALGVTPAKWNTAGTAAPAVTDDSTDGYGVLSLWYVASGDDAGKLFWCADATEGAAVWNEFGAQVYAADVAIDPAFGGLLNGATDVQEALGRVDAGRAITHPYVIRVFEPDTAVATGDGKQTVTVPSLFDGMNLTKAHACLYTASSSGTPTVQIARIRGASTVDMLSTRVTVDASELTSYTAATAPVIDTSNDDVATGDRLRIDVDVAGTGAKGLDLHLEFRLP